jgi:hypothetical protein
MRLSWGSFSLMAEATVKPPTPESNMPMGLVSIKKPALKYYFNAGSEKVM